MSAVFNGNKTFSKQPILKKEVKRDFENIVGNAYHVYIQGCAEKSFKAGKCELIINGLLNQIFLKMWEVNDFDVFKFFVHTTQYLVKEI